MGVGVVDDRRHGIRVDTIDWESMLDVPWLREVRPRGSAEPGCEESTESSERVLAAAPHPTE